MILHRTAVITRPGAPSRRGEVDAVRTVLERELHAGRLDAVVSLEGPATLDGGDVLICQGGPPDPPPGAPGATGSARVRDRRPLVLVGRSNRTNEAGIAQLAACLGDQATVVALSLPGAGLHLKSIVSALDEETLVVAAEASAFLREELERAIVHTNMKTDAGMQLSTSRWHWQWIEVPSLLASNVVRVRGTVLGQGDEAARQILQRACDVRGLRLEWVDMSETAKADGALTCCSVLF